MAGGEGVGRDDGNRCQQTQILVRLKLMKSAGALVSSVAKAAGSSASRSQISYCVADTGHPCPSFVFLDVSRHLSQSLGG